MTARAPVASLLVSLLCLVWGSTWLVIQNGLRDLPPFQSAAARFVVAALVMTLAARLFAKRETGGRPPAWLALTVGVCNFALSYGIVYWTETRLPSGLTSVLWAVFPMMMAASGHWLLGERLNRAQVAGFALGFAGVVMLFLTDIRAIGGGALAAAAVLLVSPLVATVGTTALKLHGAKTSSLLVNRDAMWVGALLLSLAAWLFERGEPARWTGAAIASVAYLAVFGTALTFGLYFWLLRHTPAHRLSLISYVTPAIALVLGKSVGGERIGTDTLAGSALILAGVAIVVRARRPREEPAAERGEEPAGSSR